MSGNAPASLQRLREQGSARLDPARWRYLEALASRIEGQPAPVQRLLQAKLEAAVAEFERQSARKAQAAADPQATKRVPPMRCVPLAQLNEHIRAATAGRHASDEAGEPRARDELASVRRFRQTWHAVRALEQFEQALARKPEQAGPLNSHMLVLQSLALMREQSPHYLRRFLVYAEALQWLEQARQLPRAQPKAAAKPAAKSARRARKKP